MSTEQLSSSRRSDERCQVFQSLSLNVLVEYEVQGRRESRQVDLVDLSPGGAKLRCAEALPLHEAIDLSFNSARAGFRLDVSASASWGREESPGNWHFGCAFQPRLPEEVFEDLLAHRAIERRTFERHLVRCAAEAKWEAMAGVHPVFLWDYSDGGFSLLSATPLPENGRVLLWLGEGNDRVEVVGCGRWRMKAGTGQLVGCSFVSHRGLQSIIEYLDRHQLFERPAPQSWLGQMFNPRPGKRR